MASVSKSITYGLQDFPAGTPAPSRYYFALYDASGAPVGPEQAHGVPVSAIPVTAPDGLYTLRGGQRDATGAEIGTPVTSLPFVIGVLPPVGTVSHRVVKAL